MAGTWIVRTRLWTFDDLSSMFAEMDPWGPALSRLTYSVSCLCSRRKARHSQPLGVLPDQVSALQIQGLVCGWIQAFLRVRAAARVQQHKSPMRVCECDGEEPCLVRAAP
jgi:hypothetical protein